MQTLPAQCSIFFCFLLKLVLMPQGLGSTKPSASIQCYPQAQRNGSLSQGRAGEEDAI